MFIMYRTTKSGSPKRQVSSLAVVQHERTIGIQKPEIDLDIFRDNPILFAELKELIPAFLLKTLTKNSLEPEFKQTVGLV